MKPTRWGALVAALVAALTLGLFGVPPAWAATTYDLKGAWDSPPASISPSQPLKATWYLNLNDDAAAPGNAPVENVTAVFTATNGVFASIPEACLVSGVTPASAISADGHTLTCNVGTQTQGTALRVTTTITATGKAGQTVSLSGVLDTAKVDLPPIPIVAPFGEDIAWEQSSPTAIYDGTGRVFRFQWTLFHNTGAVAGPNSVSYTVTVDSNQNTDWDATAAACQPFKVTPIAGHPWSVSYPWSAGSHPAEQTAPFVESCEITQKSSNSENGTAEYTLTLTGIDYSQLNAPRYDSTGKLLPPSQVAVASGEIVLRQNTSAGGGSVTLSSTTPTYTASDGSTSTDVAANNTAAANWTGGAPHGAWKPATSGSTAKAWTDTYRVATGERRISQWTSYKYPNDLASPTYEAGALCSILDTKYVTFTDARSYVAPPYTYNTPLPDSANQTMWYYTGTDAKLNPAATTEYDPNSWQGCGGTTGWTQTLPADLSTVRAVRLLYTVSDEMESLQPFLEVYSTLKPTAQAGQDVWMWSAYANSTSTTTGPADWQYPARGDASTPTKPAEGVTTPDSYRYDYTGSGRDVFQVVASKPTVSKTASPASLLPGETTTFTLTYAAEGDASAGITRPNYQLVDTLPVGLTYVEGSASVQPAIAVDANNRQVLTWTFDQITLNKTYTITLDAKVSAAAVAGTSFTNSVKATIDGLSATASARVWITNNGLTRVSKTSDTSLLPNADGTGTGSAAWTVTVTSADPRTQAFTDTIDILPYNGDGRGTSFSGDYSLRSVTATPGATVYYTTAPVASLSSDPAAASNGSAGSITGNTVGWSTTFTKDATAVRVIGGSLAPLATQSFTINYDTAGMKAADTLVNTAEARSAQTKLIMRTSASVSVAPYYSASLKKYVLASVGADQAKAESWLDANDAAGYPIYKVGDPVVYKVCVDNTGQSPLVNVTVTDDLQPTKGAFTVPSLAAGAQECRTYTVTYTSDAASTVVNTASATAQKPPTDPVNPNGPVTITDDPAGIRLLNHHVTVAKSADPAEGTTVKAGDTITYTVAFTNTGTAEAVVDYTDHLAGVLDDADLQTGSITSDGGVAAAYDAATKSLRMTGYVPAGGKVTITYKVTVKSDVAFGAVLLNVVTPTGDTPPTTCAPDDPLCTEHPTPDGQPITVVKQGLNCDTDAVTCALPGAEFALYDKDPADAGATPITGGFTVGADGATFTSTKLAPNKPYWLVETKAPTGHVLLPAPVQFSLTATGLTLASGNTALVAVPDAKVLTIVVSDATAGPLPKAGGDGVGVQALAGVLLVMGGLAASLITGRRRRRLAR